MPPLEGATLTSTSAIERAHRLATENSTYRAALAAISDGVITCDTAGMVTFVNAAAEALTLWTAAEAKGRPIHHVAPLMDADVQKVPDSPVLESVRRGTTIVSEKAALLVAHDGTVTPVDYHSRPMLDATGQTCGGVLVVRDIRQQRLVETALKRAEADLTQARKMEAIGRFASGVAHDFNNLLTVIAGDTELALENGIIDDETRALLTEMQTAGDRGAALTRQLLAFGRRQPLIPRPLDLNDLIRNTDRMLQRVIGEDVTLTLDLERDLPRVFADSSQIEMVLLNLATNSRDAMRHGGQLRIRTRRTSLAASPVLRGLLPGIYVEVTISDTGSGMDEDTVSRIFEPFFTTKELGKGTGLGLASVYGTVKQSGGYIYADSALGEGTTFAIYLPPATGEVARLEGNVPMAPVGLGTETILLVEGEDAVRAVAAAVLKQYGYSVLQAAGPLEAIQLATTHGDHISLLATEVIMPTMDGGTLAKQLRQLIPALAVLYLSGSSDGDLERHGVDPASDHLLRKPFRPSRLAAKVHELLSTPSL